MTIYKLTIVIAGEKPDSMFFASEELVRFYLEGLRKRFPAIADDPGVKLKLDTQHLFDSEEDVLKGLNFADRKLKEKQNIY